MPTGAMLGYNTKYYIFNAGSFQAVAETFDITPPSFTADRVDATNNDSANRTREYIQGLITPGEASFQMNFIPGNASDVLIRALQIAGTAVNHKIVFPNNVSFTFLATVIGYEPGAPVDDRMTAQVTISVSGNITQGVG